MNGYSAPVQTKIGRREVVLFHPTDLSSKVVIRPCLRRRLGLLKSNYATKGELRALHNRGKFYGIENINGS